MEEVLLGATMGTGGAGWRRCDLGRLGWVGKLREREREGERLRVRMREAVREIEKKNLQLVLIRVK